MSSHWGMFLLYSLCALSGDSEAHFLVQASRASLSLSPPPPFKLKTAHTLNFNQIVFFLTLFLLRNIHLRRRKLATNRLGSSSAFSSLRCAQLAVRYGSAESDT